MSTRRAPVPRHVTIASHRELPALVRAERDDIEPAEVAELLAGRPKTRGECADGPRPCPWASCRYHLGLEITDAGSIRVPHPTAGPTDTTPSCALDVAAEGGTTLEEIAGILNVTRERVRQIEERALIKVRRRSRAQLAEFVDDERLAAPTAPPPKVKRKNRPHRYFADELKRSVLADVDRALAEGRAVKPILDALGIEFSHVREWRRQVARGRL